MFRYLVSILVIAVASLPSVLFADELVPREPVRRIFSDWLADFFSRLAEKLMNWWLETFIRNLSDFRDSVIGFGVAFWNVLRNALIAPWVNIAKAWNEFWDYARKTWDIYKFVVDILHWIVTFFRAAYKFAVDFFLWLVGQNDEFGDWLWETIQDGLNWLGDFFVGLWERSQNFIFDNGIWLYEWVLGIADAMIGYFINLIHTIFEVTGIKVELPDGVLDMIPVMVQWGMFFNDFVPIREIFALMGIYLSFLVVMSLVRFVRGMIPGFR